MFLFMVLDVASSSLMRNGVPVVGAGRTRGGVQTSASSTSVVVLVNPSTGVELAANALAALRRRTRAQVQDGCPGCPGIPPRVPDNVLCGSAPGAATLFLR
ncbi:MAG: hypothetical protein ACYTGW_16420 [Planctomycetota bacterium]